jgi:hypothetical protein
VVKQPEIGGLIREVRLLAGLTQELFAEYLNVTSVTYGTINCWKMDDSETSAVGDRQPLPLAMHKIRQKAIYDSYLIADQASDGLNRKGFGSNLRNLMAHGLISSNDFYTSSSVIYGGLLFIYATLLKTQTITKTN